LFHSNPRVPQQSLPLTRKRNVHKIQRDRLPHRTRVAVVYVEDRWHGLGATAEPEALAEFLDGALKP
jgi:hypothetical protein